MSQCVCASARKHFSGRVSTVFTACERHWFEFVSVPVASAIRNLKAEGEKVYRSRVQKVVQGDPGLEKEF